MSWIRRCIVQIGKILALVVASTAVCAAAESAPITAIYQHQTIRFSHVQSQNGALAIGVEDPGFAALLRATGALLTWKPGERYVLLTTSVPVVASFSVGDRRYDVGPISLQATFAPYQQGQEVYLPLQEALATLDLALRQDGSVAILQPQLASLDVHATAGGVTIAAHGGARLDPRIVQQTANAITYEFSGVGTSLAPMRAVNAGGVRSIQIAQAGTVRDPKTMLTVRLSPGATLQPPRSNDDRDVVLSFSGPGPAAPPMAAQAPSMPGAAPQSVAQAAAPAAPVQSGPTAVTGVSVQPTAQGYSIAVAVSGNAAFTWHRLRDPDNRFWVDITGAQLAGPPIDEQEPDPVGALRVRQIDPQTVRIAVSLAGPKALSVSPSATGLNIDVGRNDAPADVARTGSGSVGTVISSSEQTALVTPAPLDAYGAGAPSNASWKFGPHVPTYVPTNPRLIVIDPGHGGSDRGAIHGGVAEADVTLDTAKRLRDILVSRGWQVKMTHDTDVDVYAPDDSARQELQARVDVANNAGARLFVSIHANAFINSGPYGTTCYVSKPSDIPLARLIERNLAADGTKDDGIVKSHLYVTLHTLMPAVLVETAFLSNPSDFSLLTSPAWRQKIAEEMADGIDQYAQRYPVPNQPAQ
ncbi:MAG TPA: N-acetylmuramoyl-L-alanine amidase [Candidatus Baltobacteraceae bacterium]|nr:N-acetylmuramoyl-L-alanine amidase [Candidatus Baltobacteraceae bacterium]